MRSTGQVLLPLDFRCDRALAGAPSASAALHSFVRSFIYSFIHISLQLRVCEAFGRQSSRVESSVGETMGCAALSGGGMELRECHCEHCAANTWAPSRLPRCITGEAGGGAGRAEQRRSSARGACVQFDSTRSVQFSYVLECTVQCTAHLREHCAVLDWRRTVLYMFTQ